MSTKPPHSPFSSKRPHFSSSSMDPSTYYDRKGWNTPPRQYTGVEGKYYNGMDMYGTSFHDHSKQYHQYDKHHQYMVDESITSRTSKQSKKQKEHKNVRDVFIRFANTTSLQGIPFINTASRWYAKGLWVFIFIVATFLWVGHSYYLINEYLKYDTSSSVAIVYEHAEFPSVTFCNINPVRIADIDEYGTDELKNLLEALKPRTSYGGAQNSATTNSALPTAGPGQNSATSNSALTTGDSPTGDPSVGRRRLLNYNYDYDNYEDQDDFYVSNGGINWVSYVSDDSDYAAVITSNTTSSSSKALSVLKDILSDLPKKNRTTMGHSLSTMMLSCSYDGETCNARNFTRTLDINYGNCWTFNSNSEGKSALNSKRGGASLGLDLTLYTETKEYLKGLQIGRGIRVHIHPFGTMPFVSDNGISVSPGKETYVGIRVLNQTRLGGVYGACDDDNGQFVGFYNNTYLYTLEGCINTCLVRTLAKHCGCFQKSKIQYIPQELASLKPCRSSKDSVCVNTYVNNGFDCGCNQACNTVDYETVISQDLWPDDSLWHSLVDAVCVRDTSACNFFKEQSAEHYETVLRNNFVHLKLYFRDLNVQKIKEMASYEPIQFASDFGGAVGLWLGASLITVMELMDFSFQLCRYFTRRTIYKKRKHQHALESNAIDGVHRDNNSSSNRPYVDPYQNKLPRLDQYGGRANGFSGRHGLGSDNSV